MKKKNKTLPVVQPYRKGQRTANGVGVGVAGEVSRAMRRGTAFGGKSLAQAIEQRRRKKKPKRGSLPLLAPGSKKRG